jgi:uncharacterized protein
MTARPLVLYHANCPDGFCAAWVAHRQFGGGADYLPVQYGEPPPDVSGRDVFIVDFSYKRPVMLEVIGAARAVVVLDHHKTAAAELAGDLSVVLPGPSLRQPHVVFDLTKSGGRLTWEHFFPGKPAPWLVDYTEDRDLWRWKLDWSREISAFIASHPHRFSLWDGWDLTPPGCGAWDTFVDAGSAILRYQAQQVEAICATAREVDLDGHKVLAANAPVLISEVAGRLAEGRPFGASWFVRSDGKQQWSLRSRDGGVDVAEVARRRGGGGHRNAAGFEGPL